MSPIAALAGEAVQSHTAASTADPEAVPGDPTAATHRSIGEWLPIGIWAGLIVAAGGTGAIYGKAHPEWRLNAAPFFRRRRIQPGGAASSCRPRGSRGLGRTAPGAGALAGIRIGRWSGPVGRVPHVG